MQREWGTWTTLAAAGAAAAALNQMPANAAAAAATNLQTLPIAPSHSDCVRLLLLLLSFSASFK